MAKMRSKIGYFAISKVYLAKVYDSIKLSFIHTVLTQICLSPTCDDFKSFIEDFLAYFRIF